MPQQQQPATSQARKSPCYNTSVGRILRYNIRERFIVILPDSFTSTATFMPQPPPPRNAAFGSSDSTDAFFNDYQQSPAALTSVRERGGVPPIGQPRPRPPQPQQTATTARLPTSAAGRGPVRNPSKPQHQPRPPPPSQPRPPTATYPQPTPSNTMNQPSSSYYSSTTASAASNYGISSAAPSSVQPQISQPAYNESPSNDWYTPSDTDAAGMVSNNIYGIVQPQPQAAQSQYSQPSSTATSSAYNPNYTQPTSNTYFNGTMDTSGRDTTPYPMPQTFIPQPQYNNTSPVVGDLTDYNFENEPPLLEELGVNWEHIMMKTKAVVIPFRRFQKHSALADPSIIVEDADLAGPLAYALLLGGELLVTGKLQFGYIYGFGLFGCLAMTLIMNLMSPTSISFWTVTSILGYALIPVNILAAIKIFLFSFRTLVQMLALITVLWSTTASTRLLEIGFGLTDQRYLLAYPIALLYSAFVLITIF